MKSLAPRPSVISESFKLNTVTQSPDVYMGRVKLTAQNCDYGDAFDRIVRDKFICGLRDERVKVSFINDSEVKGISEKPLAVKLVFNV